MENTVQDLVNEFHDLGSRDTGFYGIIDSSFYTYSCPPIYSGTLSMDSYWGDPTNTFNNEGKV